MKTMATLKRRGSSRYMGHDGANHDAGRLSFAAKAYGLPTPAVATCYTEQFRPAKRSACVTTGGACARSPSSSVHSTMADRDDDKKVRLTSIKFVCNSASACGEKGSHRCTESAACHRYGPYGPTRFPDKSAGALAQIFARIARCNLHAKRRPLHQANTKISTYHRVRKCTLQRRLETQRAYIHTVTILARWEARQWTGWIAMQRCLRSRSLDERCDSCA